MLYDKSYQFVELSLHIFLILSFSSIIISSKFISSNYSTKKYSVEKGSTVIPKPVTDNVTEVEAVALKTELPTAFERVYFTLKVL